MLAGNDMRQFASRTGGENRTAPSSIIGQGD